MKKILLLGASLILIGVGCFSSTPTAVNTPAKITPVKETGQTVTPKSNSTVVPAQNNAVVNPEQVVTPKPVEPAAEPKRITPTQEQCFYTQLGTERANAIKNGTAPTAEELVKVKVCL